MQVQIGPGSVLLKAGVIVVIGLLLLIPVALLQGLVSERAARRQEAIQQVARGWGGEQAFAGPLIVMPVTSPDPTRPHTRNVFIVPHSLAIDARLDVEQEPRRLGMYEVPVYVATARITGELDLPTVLATLRTEFPDATPHPERARLVIPVSDLQGLRKARETDTNLTISALEPARELGGAALGAWLRPDSGLVEGKQRFAFELELAGTHALDFLPLARSTEVAVRGDWPHPGLTRGQLPTVRRTGGDGFEARWQTLAMNRGVPKYWLEGEKLDSHPGRALPVEAFGVTIVQPVDLHARVERTVKYAGLFIAISLLALFIWEHVARQRVHPVQYGLVGLALGIFYLLLLALAEHIGFGAAYALAALALCGLLGGYLAGAFDGIAAGSAASAGFGVIYGLLYLIVTAEDYALLAGALSLFALLAAAMLLTRRLDWYEVGAAARPQNADG
jgi:inner membrane protein